MAYIVVTFKGQEVGRWPLELALTIGRSTECDVCVRDILLSRRHCQIIPYRGGWIAVDLQSKNGTRCGGELIQRRGLADGDILTLGKCSVRFQVGRLQSTYVRPARRPKDPFEAFANTVSEFDARQLEAFREANNMPSPKPMPREPEAYANEDIYSLISGIASSSWDSIYAQASRRRRPIPRIHALLAPADRAAVERVILGSPIHSQTRRDASRNAVSSRTPPARVYQPTISSDGHGTIDLPGPRQHAGWLRRTTSALAKPVLIASRWLRG